MMATIFELLIRFWPLALWCALVVFYVLYLAAINIWAHRADIGLQTKLAALPVLVTMLLVDMVMQITFATVIFFDWPHEWLVTQRLQRYRAGDPGWRCDVATWVCTTLLNPFDPTRDHC